MKQKNWMVIILSSIYFLLIFSTLYYAIFGDLSILIGKELPSWYNYFIFTTFIIYFVGFIYILKMKKLALISLSAITVTLYIFSIAINVFSFVTLITDIIIFGLLWTQFKKMKWTLTLTLRNFFATQKTVLRTILRS